jgi:hypothetical protein
VSKLTAMKTVRLPVILCLTPVCLARLRHLRPFKHKMIFLLKSLILSSLSLRKTVGAKPLHGPGSMISVISWRTFPYMCSGKVAHNQILSVGGGSVIDTAKAANL